MKEINEQTIIVPRNEEYIRQGVPRISLPFIIIDVSNQLNPDEHYTFKQTLN